MLRMMAANLDSVTVKGGELVMTAGRRNDAFWILLEGSVELTIGGRIREELGPGDLFGLPSMFAGRESAADVVALTDVEALVASHQQFQCPGRGHGDRDPLQGGDLRPAARRGLPADANIGDRALNDGCCGHEAFLTLGHAAA